MSIVPQTLLDNITIQFSYGGEHQLAKPGEVEGAHFVEIEYLVEDSTGAIAGKTQNPRNGMAQEIDPAKVAGLLGEKFATFAAQLAEARKQVAELAEALSTAKAEAATSLADKDAQIAERDKQIAELSAAKAETAARNAAAVAALTGGATA